jgi:hypothetical protein
MIHSTDADRKICGHSHRIIVQEVRWKQMKEVLLFAPCAYDFAETKRMLEIASGR